MCSLSTSPKLWWIRLSDNLIRIEILIEKNQDSVNDQNWRSRTKRKPLNGYRSALHHSWVKTFCARHDEVTCRRKYRTSLEAKLVKKSSLFGTRSTNNWALTSCIYWRIRSFTHCTARTFELDRPDMKGKISGVSSVLNMRIFIYGQR